MNWDSLVEGAAARGMTIRKVGREYIVDGIPGRYRKYSGTYHNIQSLFAWAMEGYSGHPIL